MEPPRTGRPRHDEGTTYFELSRPVLQALLCGLCVPNLKLRQKTLSTPHICYLHQHPNPLHHVHTPASVIVNTERTREKSHFAVGCCAPGPGTGQSQRSPSSDLLSYRQRREQASENARKPARRPPVYAITGAPGFIGASVENLQAAWSNRHQRLGSAACESQLSSI